MTSRKTHFTLIYLFKALKQMWWARVLSAAGLPCTVTGVNLPDWEHSSLGMDFQQERLLGLSHSCVARLAGGAGITCTPHTTLQTNCFSFLSWIQQRLVEAASRLQGVKALLETGLFGSRSRGELIWPAGLTTWLCN